MSNHTQEQRAREQLLREFTQITPKQDLTNAIVSQADDATSSSSISSLSPPRPANRCNRSGQPAPHSIDALVSHRKPSANPAAIAPTTTATLEIPPHFPTSFEHALNNLKALATQTQKTALSESHHPIDMSKQFMQNENSTAKQNLKRVVDLSQTMPKRQKLDSSSPKSDPSQFAAPINLSIEEWGDNHPESKKLTNQIAMMLLVDRQHPMMVDRGGFRALLKTIFPKYQMPSADKFQSDILPSLLSQLNSSSLRSDFAMKFWQNNMFSPHNLAAPISTTTEIAGLISPTTTVESGRSDSSTSSSMGDRDDIENDAPKIRLSAVAPSAIDRATLQNSIRSAQNISRSFSHSLQLGVGEDDSDSSSSADSEVSIQDKLDVFIDHIGRYVFPYDDIVSLVGRCHQVFQHFEHNPLDCAYLQSQSASNGKGKLVIPKLESGQPELSRSLQFVLNYFPEIIKSHENHPIPDFIAFSTEEQQFLTDLNDHVSAL
ncbi:hypothetical protein L596_004608 [Steinernema carpocapsae]|uniref:Uncharacterized protein n=1 Tax=Steinernema carpocapsae TaxID=34508 RepID=A0A4U8UXE2_STECR|nr:hypothetical protein L596_004608 [Steinernema carpocapsae]